MGLLSINRDPDDRQLRQFAGIWFPLMCGLIGYALWRRFAIPDAAYGVWGLGGLVFVAGLAAPKLVKPLFVGLMYLTFPIGFVVSHVLVFAAFFLVLTPMGLLLRLFGYDPMKKSFDPSARTYWTERAPNVNFQRYFKQY
ncbi:MAG: hypothetical protein KIS92_21205 [Planctomycetota bacterium]|nr:hypothetical protein [Planctomycetota bacterium]